VVKRRADPPQNAGNWWGFAVLDRTLPPRPFLVFLAVVLPVFFLLRKNAILDCLADALLTPA
jgi:hypothetical protein